MRISLLVRLVSVIVSSVFLAASARAAQAPDSALVEGLNSAVTNGVESALRIWYADRQTLGNEIREKLVPVTRPLGPIVDTEIVATQAISQRVTRYYVAIYFEHRPLWLRIERYSNGQKTFFLPLRFSTNPDEILPGYVTNFHAAP